MLEAQGKKVARPHYPPILGRDKEGALGLSRTGSPGKDRILAAPDIYGKHGIPKNQTPQGFYFNPEKRKEETPGYLIPKYHRPDKEAPLGLQDILCLEKPIKKLKYFDFT